MYEFPRLRLRAHEERRLAQGHLWVYSNEVDVAQTPLKSLTPGQQVVVESHNGKALGVAIANPNALICARLVSRQATQPLDQSLLVHRLQMALALREQCYSQPYYRLVYGDADLLPGLVVDRFGEYLVAQMATAGMELLRDALIGALVKVLKPIGILLKNDASVRTAEGLASYVEVVYGDVPEEITLVENDTRFNVPVFTGQKTGWFFDHRESRRWLLPQAQGKRVLDVFSYLGGWGVQLAKAGANDVLCLDASELALGFVEKNAALNAVEGKVRVRQGDAFELLTALRQEGEMFDVVIVDPPAFIKRRKDFKNGFTAYRRINELAMRLLNRNGLLVSCSCSMHLSRDELVDVMRGAGRHVDRLVQIVHHGHQGADHPIHPAIAETEYLKAIVARVTRAE